MFTPLKQGRWFYLVLLAVLASAVGGCTAFSDADLHRAEERVEEDSASVVDVASDQGEEEEEDQSAEQDTMAPGQDTTAELSPCELDVMAPFCCPGGADAECPQTMGGMTCVQSFCLPERGGCDEGTLCGYGETCAMVADADGVELAFCSCETTQSSTSGESVCDYDGELCDGQGACRPLPPGIMTMSTSP